MKDLKIHKRYKDGTMLNFTLTEGKNREIRKICKALDLHVRKLKRVQIGDVQLGELPLGTWRNLTEDEVKKLLKP